MLRSLAFIAAALLVLILLGKIVSEARAPQRTTDPSVRVVNPPPPLIGTTLSTLRTGPSTVAAADTSGRTVRAPRVAPPEPGFRPVAVVTGPAGWTGDPSESAPGAPVVIDAPASTSGPGLFPEFFPRPPVIVSTLGEPGSAPDSARAVVTFQPRPIIELRPTVLAGFDVAFPNPVEQPDLGAFVAVSPVRVWGFRPDLGARVQLGAGAGSLADRTSVSAGLSVEILDRLRIRGARTLWSASGGAYAAPEFQAGFAYRFR